jgi:hypothetical protein
MLRSLDFPLKSGSCDIIVYDFEIFYESQTLDDNIEYKSNHICFTILKNLTNTKIYYHKRLNQNKINLQFSRVQNIHNTTFFIHCSS